MAAGELIAEVYAERIDVRVRLYRVGPFYRLRFSGLGWHPQRMRDQADGMKRLLACASYGPGEQQMIALSCRENP